MAADPHKGTTERMEEEGIRDPDERIEITLTRGQARHPRLHHQPPEPKAAVPASPLTVPSAVPVAWDRAGHGPPVVYVEDEPGWEGATI